MTALLALAAALLGAPVAAEPNFSPASSEACVADIAARSGRLDDYAALDCVGRAAEACFVTPGGDTTLGMMECLQAELSYWDARLNAAYAKRLQAAKTQDAEVTIRRTAAPLVADSLRGMQRAWITFRDAACLYEQAQWHGGTGGGPATLACHMHETARQTLRLEGWWAQ